MSRDLEIRVIRKASKEHPRHSEASIVELKDGKLLMAWIEFNRSEKGGGDNAPANIAALVSEDGGRNWGSYRILKKSQPGDLSVFSPNLLRLANGDILFLYFAYHRLDDGVVPSTSCYVCKSKDEGKTFSPPVPLWSRKPWAHASGVVKQLWSGRILLPMDWQTGLVWSTVDHAVAGCLYSDDGGVSWKEPSSWVNLPLRGAMESHVVELKNGKVMMILRTQLGAVFKCISKDNGETWSKPQTTGLKSPESCPEVIRIPRTGDLLLVWNNGIYDPALNHFGKRTPLTAAISRDDGETWQNMKNIEKAPNLAFSNPGCAITSQNKVVLTYWVAKYYPDGRLNGNRISLKAALFDVDWLYQ